MTVSVKKRWFAKIFLGFWALILCVISAYQLASHLVTLPQPAHDDPILAARLEATRAPAAAGRWHVVHILYGECKCSRQVAEHILDRGPLPDVSERVLFIGDDDEMAARFAAVGYPVDVTTTENLKCDWNVEAAPLLVIADPFGGLQYVGGYTERKQGPNVQDVSTIAAVMNEVEVPALPLFGCAVSRTLAAAVDPFGVR